MSKSPKVQDTVNGPNFIIFITIDPEQQTRLSSSLTARIQDHFHEIQGPRVVQSPHERVGIAAGNSTSLAAPRSMDADRCLNTNMKLYRLGLRWSSVWHGTSWYVAYMTVSIIINNLMSYPWIGLILSPWSVLFDLFVSRLLDAPLFSKVLKKNHPDSSRNDQYQHIRSHPNVFCLYENLHFSDHDWLVVWNICPCCE